MADNSFLPLLDWYLAQEKQNSLLPFEQYRERLIQELAEVENEFLQRFKRGNDLIKERFEDAHP